MRTLFAKILLAQVITVLLALVVVMAITQASLNRGFIDFLERQEAAVLDITAPVLAELYEERGGWEFLREQPANWHAILRQTHARLPAGTERGRGPPRGRPPGVRSADSAGGRGAENPLRWLRSLDRLQLRDRLFLLDEQQQFLAGATVQDPSDLKLQEIRADGAAVGWVGFAPIGKTLPPEAERFLYGQLRVLSAAFVIALCLAALLGYLLARHLSQPVRRLMDTVTELAHGHYDARAATGGRDEVSRLSEEINQLAATLQKNRTARQRWMADIAHELRTPVAILKGEIEALADGVREPDRQNLASLGEEIEQLAALVTDLQALASSDAGALGLRREKIDLGEVVRQAAGSFRERLAGRGIELRLEVPEILEISGDAQRLRQLLNNLLENCVRYSEGDGWVKISLGPSDKGLQLTVEDSGPGVPEAELNHLFDRFYRLEVGRSRAGGGSGLGLSICRNIAEAHGGVISAERSAAGGLLVRTVLPAWSNE
jgi:two-component system sensor histidine kinase BaeS